VCGRGHFLLNFFFFRQGIITCMHFAKELSFLCISPHSGCAYSLCSNGSRKVINQFWTEIHTQKWLQSDAASVAPAHKSCVCVCEEFPSKVIRCSPSQLFCELIAECDTSRYLIEHNGRQILQEIQSPRLSGK
jgi:hypothetical protein